MNLADGQWHRLHPATPLLRGGIAFVALIGFIIANLRERLLEFFFHVPAYGDDPVEQIYSRGLVGWALLGVLVVLILIVAGFYAAWRVHSFRITEDLVEVRSGLISRTHRRARLDRIQGVAINRPVLARLFGAAKLDITVAGHDANVQLAYLTSAATDELRREILRLASGARRAAALQESPADAAGAPSVPPGSEPTGVAPAAPPLPGSRLADLVTHRVEEFLAPELDPDTAPPESVVRIPPVRLLASIVLSPFTLILLGAVIAMIVGFSRGELWPVFVVLPAIIGGASYYVGRISRQLRYSIAGTPDGVRVGYGLLSTNNETLPPGRIHAIGIDQPLMWRPFGWWRVQVNTAARAQSDRQNRDNTTLLPVGTAADVRTVLELVLPTFAGGDAEGAIEVGMLSHGGADGFTGAPRSAAWLRPFSWRRTGYRLITGVALVRRGILSRQLAVVPLARLQSVALQQGPLHRMLGLAAVHLQTVSGPVDPRLDVAAATDALALFGEIGADAVTYARLDTSHHWGAVS